MQRQQANSYLVREPQTWATRVSAWRRLRPSVQKGLQTEVRARKTKVMSKPGNIVYDDKII
jgi:hypothetical protein